MSKGPDLQYVRGDTKPIILHFTTAAGVDLDVSGYTILTLAIDPEAAPETPGANLIDAMPGSFVTDGTDGRVAFIPSGADETARRATSEGYAIGKAFYDVSGINAAGQRDTILDPGGKISIDQQIGVT